jgi:hypothetical protein
MLKLMPWAQKSVECGIRTGRAAPFRGPKVGSIDTCVKLTVRSIWCPTTARGSVRQAILPGAVGQRLLRASVT